MPSKVVRKYWRYIVVSLALLVGIALLSQDVLASNGRTFLEPLNVPVSHSSGGHTRQSVEDAITDTDTPTSTSTPAGSVTPSPAMLVGHVIWEGISQPNSRNVKPITLTLTMGSTQINYPSQNTDTSGYFTVSVESLAPGTYTYRARGVHSFFNEGFVTLTGAPTTSLDIGTLMNGDSNGDNITDMMDFVIFRATF